MRIPTSERAIWSDHLRRKRVKLLVFVTGESGFASTVEFI
jgi:hypothetical protein